MQDLLAFYSSVLCFPLKSSEDELSLYKIKELVKKNYDAQLTLLLRDQEFDEDSVRSIVVLSSLTRFI